MCLDYEYAAGNKTSRGIYRDSQADNPYADEAMWKVENAINAASEKVHALVGWLEQVLCAVPANITMTDVVSRSPLNIGVYSSSPLGYRCVWLLVGYDQMALKAFQASHFGLISWQKRDELLSHGGYLIRKIYGILRGIMPSLSRDRIWKKNTGGRTGDGTSGASCC